MRTTIFYILSISFLLGSLPTAQANNKYWLQQRWHFKDAVGALENEDLKAFKRLSAQIEDYPIAHYLRYLYLESHLETEKAETILAFLEQYKDSPFVQPLREAWLSQLAKKRDWETFIAAYTPQEDTVLRCYYLQAHLHTQGHIKGQLDDAKDLWVVGKSQPDECDPAFKYLYDNEIITSQLRWERIRLVMQNRKLGLARFIARGLSKTDQQLAKRWRLMYANPARELKKFKHPDSAIAREIVLHGLKRLAYKNVVRAYNYWQDYQKRYAFTEAAKIEMFQHIILRGVRQKHPKAAQWLEEVDPNFVDETIKQAMLQFALAQQDWQAVIKLISSLPVAEQNELKWQYWLARALEKTGHTDDAEQQFQDLSQNRHYYGFLAADRLGKPYSFQPESLTVSKDIKNQLVENNAAVIRARELYIVGLTAFAREEWQAVLPTLTTEELEAAAVLAHEWGWHDKAIATIFKAGHYNDLKIRFPLPFYDTVLTQAQAQRLEFAYVYAIIRQESAFQTDARSTAGALGLMQLMPRTAKQMARKRKMKLKNTGESLFVPDINILLGTTYLRQMLNKFGGNRPLAAAAYNAGPKRAKRWAKKYGCLPPDIWVELIPFDQTRDYVQRVLSYTSVFEYQMVGHPQVKPMLLDVIQTKGCTR